MGGQRHHCRPRALANVSIEMPLTARAKMVGLFWPKASKSKAKSSGRGSTSFGKMLTAVRGDWFYTPRRVPHCCRMYLSPGIGQPLGNIPQGTFLGPVHDSEWSAGGVYLAICVPYVQTASQKIYENPSDAPSLVWISIYCAHNRRRDWSKPVHFAKKVSTKEIQSWADHGWVNQFLD